MFTLGPNLGLLVWKKDVRFHYNEIGYTTEMFIEICNALLSDIVFLTQSDCCKKCHLKVLISFVKMHYLQYYDEEGNLVEIPPVDLDEPLD